MDLQKSVKIASHLARSTNAIRKLKEEQPLEDEQSWVFNLFSIDWDLPHQEDKGKITFMILNEDKEQAETLLSLSQNISNNSLTKKNWELILDGLIKYRRSLLSKAHQCSIGCSI